VELLMFGVWDILCLHRCVSIAIYIHLPLYPPLCYMLYSAIWMLYISHIPHYTYIYGPIPIPLPLCYILYISHIYIYIASIYISRYNIFRCISL